jgi:SAM-dependent methyltransferase
MNLFDMWRHKDPNLVLTQGASASKQALEGQTWKGFQVVPSESPQIRLRGAPSWYPFTERAEMVGWMACSRRAGVLKIWFSPSDSPRTELSSPLTLQLCDRLLPVRIPWPFGNSALPPDAELVIHAPATNPSAVFLAIHSQLDRSDLIRLARGRGVEIGPGHQPQILPGQDTDVLYIEQTLPEQWIKLYDPKQARVVDKSLWDAYRIGTADSLPVPDSSLDFVFSSHVFEHLANPLGHLDHWRNKLKPGGLVLAVVPDVAGWKDYAFQPCSLASLTAEFATGSMAPTVEHYRRWVHGRRLQADPLELLQSNRSIHVHYYTNRNMAELLQWAVDHLDFAYFHLRHTPNAKDFHFVLCKKL